MHVTWPDCPFGLRLFCLVASVVLHGLIAVSVFNANRSKPESPHREQLVIQVVGLVSDRQLDEKKLGGEDHPQAPLPPVAPPREQAKQAKPPERPKPKTPKQALLKARSKKAETAPEPEPVREPLQPPAPAASPAAAQTMPKGTETQQVQQTLQPRESEATLIRRYLASLRRDIQNHLEYPREARAIGPVGSPVIHFTITESGGILPGSLSVQKSSGSSLLDQKAMQAARDAAPMPKPPRQMAVTITVAFTQDE